MATEQKFDFTLASEVLEFPEYEVVRFGNTGLSIEFNKLASVWRMHFLPDGYAGSLAGKQTEFGLRFVISIKMLIDWFNNTDFETKPFFKPNFLFGHTNGSMNQFRKTLFDSLDPQIYKFNRFDTSDSYDYVLDLQILSEALKYTKSDNKFIRRLKQAQEIFNI